VRRSGTYELLQGEELNDLIEVYADGFTLDADTSGVVLTRTATDSTVGRERIEVDLAAAPAYPLRDSDSVGVLSEGARLPWITVSGALVPEQSGETGPTTRDVSGFTRLRFRIIPGQKLHDFLRSQNLPFLESADLARAELRRADGSMIPVDLASMSTLGPGADSPVLAGGDELLVPFDRPIVVVSGAVAAPGTYRFVPDRTADYYVNLAGGYDPARTWFRNPRITDRSGARLTRSDPVPPEASIVVPTNNLFQLLDLGTAISVTTGIVSLILLITR